MHAHLTRTAGLLFVAASLLTWALPRVSSQGAAGAQDAEARVADSLLGVSVGSKLVEVHEKLKGLGTVGGRETREGGRKEAWALKETEFKSIAYKTDASGRVVWVTGFVRPGREIPFEQLGSLSRASARKENQAVWNVEKPGGGYRLIAKGPNGKASVVTLLALNASPLQ